MAKQSFTLARDLRIKGEHVAAGTAIPLDTEDPKDAALIGQLLSSNALTAEDHEKLLAAQAPSAKPEPSSSTAAAPKA